MSSSRFFFETTLVVTIYSDAPIEPSEWAVVGGQNLVDASRRRRAEVVESNSRTLRGPEFAAKLRRLEGDERESLALFGLDQDGNDCD